MNVSSVAGQQDSSLSIDRRLACPVSVRGGDMDGFNGHVSAGNMTQHRLQGLERDLLGAVEGCVVEIDHADAARAWPRDIHAGPGQVEAGAQLLRIGKLN